MKKMMMIVGLCLLLSGILAAEKSRNPADLNYSRIYTGTILEQVTSRLKQIEELSSAHPDQASGARMRQLLQETYALLELLPQDIDISASREGYIAPKADPPVGAQSDASNSKLKPRLTPVPDRYPIAAKDYEDLHKAMARETTNKEKLAILKDAAQSYRFSTQQIIGLLLALNQSYERLSALQMIFPNSTDPQNKDQILEVFSSKTDQEKAIWLMQD